MNKKIFLPVVFAIAILSVGLLSTTSASAQDAIYPPIVERLAEKFGLNKDEVRNVFDEVRNERSADMYANFVERLDDLVAEGILSQEQKDALLAKHEELQTKLENLRGKNISSGERKKEIKALNDEFINWAQGQGIDLSKVRPLGQNFGKARMLRGMWMGMPY